MLADSTHTATVCQQRRGVPVRVPGCPGRESMQVTGPRVAVMPYCSIYCSTAERRWVSRGDGRRQGLAGPLRRRPAGASRRRDSPPALSRNSRAAWAKLPTVCGLLCGVNHSPATLPAIGVCGVLDASGGKRRRPGIAGRPATSRTRALEVSYWRSSRSSARSRYTSRR